MSDTESRLKQLSEQQLGTLNLQKRYEARVQDDIERVYDKTYYVLQQRQQEVFAECEKHIGEKGFKLEQKIDKASAKLNQATKKAEEAVSEIKVFCDKLCSINSLRDLMYYAAPAAVLMNLLFRIIQHFS